MSSLAISSTDEVSEILFSILWLLKLTPNMGLIEITNELSYFENFRKSALIPLPKAKVSNSSLEVANENWPTLPFPPALSE